MAGSYISAALRLLVSERAGHACGYCLLAETVATSCEVDHIISEKHGGPTNAENLAFACVTCNQRKGSDTASLATAARGRVRVVRLFHPRRDRWAAHFALEGNLIQPRSPVGEATARLLDFNGFFRRLERATLQTTGHYPAGRRKP